MYSIVPQHLNESELNSTCIEQYYKNKVTRELFTY